MVIVEGAEERFEFGAKGFSKLVRARDFWF